MSSESITELIEAFWVAFKVKGNQSLWECFIRGPNFISLLAGAMGELVAFYNLSKKLKWGGRKRIIERMNKLIIVFIAKLRNQYAANDFLA